MKKTFLFGAGKTAVTIMKIKLELFYMELK